MPRSNRARRTPRAMKDIEAGLRQLTVGLRGLAREMMAGVHNGAKTRRRPITPALRLQGRYMGLIRTLPERKKREVMAIRASKGVKEAIRAARRIRS